MIRSINIYSKKVDTGKYYPVVRIPKTLETILKEYPNYYRHKPNCPYAPAIPYLEKVFVPQKNYTKWLNHLSEEDYKIFSQYIDTTQIVYEESLSDMVMEELKNTVFFETFDFSDAQFIAGYLPGICISIFCIYLIVFDAYWFFYIPPIICAIFHFWMFTTIIITIKGCIEYRKRRWYRTIRKLINYVCRLKDYVMRLDEYKIAYFNYKIELNEYNKAIDNKILNPNIYNIRQTKYTDSLFFNTQELTYNEIGSINKGMAECFFYKKMLSYNNFPFDIFINVKITHKKTRNEKIEYKEDGNTCYFPDFLLCSNNGWRKIYYDIEIDEPYIFSSGEPIHVEGMDNSRDEFFYNHNVIVIRFAESQVFKNPSKCLQYIVDIHHKILSMHIEDIINVTCDFKVDRWTEALAIEWNKINYRNSYTPKRLTQTYNIEYDGDSWVLICSSQLDKQERAKIKSIKTVKWYSRKSLLINMIDGEERYIDISPSAVFTPGLNINPETLWIETYINKNNEKIYFGYYRSCGGELIITYAT